MFLLLSCNTTLTSKTHIFFQGMLTLCITNPIWVTKTQLVLQYSAERSKKQYKGMVDALIKIYKHEGIPGLYRVSCHTTYNMLKAYLLLAI